MLTTKTAVKYFITIFLFVCLYQARGQTAQNSNRICGKWMSSEKNLTVEVYKKGDEFKARIVWFRDDPGKPMDEWRDSHNPDPALRSRKILGLDVLRGLKYDKDGDSWEDGIVYDAKHGKDWNASAFIDAHGLLRVRGYWHFKIFGKTMTFKRP
ncbi:MAG TPA: DUF2147 domain-containing protein [Mucilaginibacter sp.]|jgi:uncharacterized protein (DUF2147 family)|nr:DUF2147 domain-containing protein [Mucilaginibacter sp.]HWD89797.1 DUF2147 domain-containing protein [Mucilaginibacter sp.]